MDNRAPGEAGSGRVWRVRTEQGAREDPPGLPGYRVGRRIGVGGSSTVWAAIRERDGYDVALKVLDGRRDEDALDAAVRELALLQRAAGEHVVRVHEVVALDEVAGESGLVVVLDRLHGGSLREVLAARGHLSDGEAVTVLAPVAHALAGLHALGIVHGDVTPGNVLLEASGRPVLSDLGVARLLGETGPAVAGTDGFVAPEVLDGETPTAASDVYAVGALGWTCLTGSAPGPAVLRGDLSVVVPHVTSALAAALGSCLAADPAARPDAGSAAVRIYDAVAPEPIRLLLVGSGASGASGASSTTGMCTCESVPTG